MTDDQIALARRAEACKGWKWTPGMRGFVPGGQYARVVDADDAAVDGWYVEGLAADEEAPGEWPEEDAEVLPDLDDPATKGALLGLVREAWDEDVGLCPQPWRGGGWEVRSRAGHVLGYDPADASGALVAALEAAP